LEQAAGPAGGASRSGQGSPCGGMCKDALVLARRLTARAGLAVGLLGDGAGHPAQVSRCGRRSRLLWVALAGSGLAALLWAGERRRAAAAPPSVTGRRRSLAAVDL
ncbi:unnamed protein product, partial [Prorocentrum cordatum]